MYVEDLSLVTHRLRDTRGADVLFVIARMEDRVCLVARSRLDAIDVSQITSEFGGGGHPTAAAATIRDLTLVQVRDRLVELLPDRILPLTFAKDMITPHAVSVLESDPIQTVNQILTRFNFSMVPVLRDGRPTGLISRKIVDKAIHHHLDQELAVNFMIRDFKSADPDTPFHQIEEWIIEQKQKLVPVTDPKSGTLLGIISRGDLLGFIYGDFRKNMEKLQGNFINVSKVSSGKNVKHLIREKMPDRIIQLLDQIRTAADEMGMQTFAVGGFVRDLLSGIPNYDLDLVVEGDGIEFARHLGEKLGGTIRTHKKFKTAKVSFCDGQVIDVATARMEFYEFPGALPKVVFGSIKNDLYRRDFSINALGIYLNGRHKFHLLDFFQGKRDIAEKAIRVLHNLSFVEDPTRILRAIRFEQRFQFSIGKQSLYLMKLAIEKDLLSRISGFRIFNELLIMLKEENPKKMIRRMDDFGVLVTFHPKIQYPPRLRKLLQAVDRVLSWYQFTFPERKVKGWEVYLRALFDELTVTEAAKTCDRLSFPQGLREKILNAFQAREEIESVLGKETARAGSAIYDLLDPFSVETLLYFMARQGHPRKTRPLVTYLSELQGTKQFLRGRDLVRMGLRPGKQYSQILKEVFSAQLDGQVKTKEEAYRFARKLAN